MKITFISDTHLQHNAADFNFLLKNGGDVLVHCGDITGRGEEKSVYNFLDWFSNTNFKHKIFISGNHDFWFETHNDIDEKYKENGVVYLFDNSIVIDGVKFYGSPWQPEFFNWAFNLPRSGPELKQKWDMIPMDVDILITHGPPMGILDMTMTGVHVGCDLLYRKVINIKPKIHAFGHIHGGYGQKEFNGTEFINASILDEQYRMRNDPINTTFNPITKEIEYL